MLKSFKFIVSHTSVQNFRVINSFPPLLTRLLHNGKFRSDNGDEETVCCVLFCIFSRLLDELKYQTILQLVICFIFLLLLLILVYFYFTERTI